MRATIYGAYGPPPIIHCTTLPAGVRSSAWRRLLLRNAQFHCYPIVNTLNRPTFVHWGDDSLEATMNRKTGCGHATSWLEFTCIPLVAFAPLALADSALEGEQQCAAVTTEQ